jgi:hypothetical protein
MITMSRILCPVDFSEHSAHAVAHAVAMARWYEARLTMLYVWINQGAADLPPLVLGDAERAHIGVWPARIKASPSTSSFERRPTSTRRSSTRLTRSVPICSSSAVTAARGSNDSCSDR